MSSDFGFWKQVSGDAEAVFEDLAEGLNGNLVASPDVLLFREQLLTRWPDLKDELEPSRFDLEESPDDVLKYVLLTLSVRQLDHLEEILTLARTRGLVGYSGVAGETL